MLRNTWRAPGSLDLTQSQGGNVPVPGSGPTPLTSPPSPWRDGNWAALFLPEDVSFYNKSSRNALATLPAEVEKRRAAGR